MARGNGHIRKRVFDRNGRTWTRWLATIELGGRGHLRQRRQRSFELKREAEMWLSEQRVEIGRGRITGAQTPTVGEHLEDWLSRGESRARDGWSPSTLYSYQKVCQTHLIPSLGHIRLSDLTIDDVEQMLERISGSKTARNVRGVLSSALAMAVKQRHVAHNAASSATLPAYERKPIEPLTQEEARRFLDATAVHDLGPLFAVTTALGLRQSEVIGLRWQDVDLDALEIHIEQRIYWIDGEYRAGPPKTLASRRTVTFPEQIAVILREQRVRALERQVAAGPSWEDWGLVFPANDGRPMYGPWVLRVMRRFLKQAGLPKIRFHDLRHTGASILLAMGVDLKVIQERLGHTDYKFTAQVYLHPEQSQEREAADAMGRFLKG